MSVDASDKTKLYIRLPVKIKDEVQIRDLHPNIIEVRLPRQKSRRWCIVEFENEAKQKEAVAALRKVKIDEKSIKFRQYKKPTENIKKGTTAEERSSKSLIKLLKKST
ncbi:hypothetical protein NQ317_013505 [Molorchus minor]|uniref:RRM domain-containing protein n=1 Tax=Molorchus minor TaxID=1323400 RepID=A0ABQ9JV36_9CUCU|nr:hypothetical protein NQ317_013505 [Molorchus minor]